MINCFEPAGMVFIGSLSLQRSNPPQIFCHDTERNSP